MGADWGIGGKTPVRRMNTKSEARGNMTTETTPRYGWPQGDSERVDKVDLPGRLQKKTEAGHTPSRIAARDASLDNRGEGEGGQPLY